ncbi:hypothetical protein HUB94_20810 (plasmid) [Paenibacillus cellulosilyticus]|uniref:hypothetical protein n=1 Tax=Paenibacillus cellulosilyticus TaxID=375489 RepID=UPI00157FFAF8|nr:hypothetical protein [Paenibacillus cellulosilyticus]QKS46918.1 hypothetical protein HUB94_20810 [Paenibacillus cellulosilyticus]
MEWLVVLPFYQKAVSFCLSKNKILPAAEQTNDSEEASAVAFVNGLLPSHDLTHSEQSGDNSDRKNIRSAQLLLQFIETQGPSQSLMTFGTAPSSSGCSETHPLF